MTDDTGAFARAHEAYWAAGWRGVLPVGRAPGEKWPPPGAYTGHEGLWPSYADVASWAAGPEGGRNIALRLPPDVIGLDVDDYGDKVGGATLAALVQRYGPLPATWVTTARDDGVSGIRLYRVPAGLHWPGEAGENIEIVQTGHRYALCWPSTNPDAAGAMYRWCEEAGTGVLVSWDDRVGVPGPTAFPALPPAWIEGLALPYDRTVPAEMADGAVREWLAACRPAVRAEDVCPPVRRVLDDAVGRLLGGARATGSRHETARDAARALAAYGGEGHAGAWAMLGQLSGAFQTACADDRGRDVGGEWMRIVVGAVKLAAAAHPAPAQGCSCALLAGEGVMFDPPSSGVMPDDLGMAPDQGGNHSGPLAEPVGSTWEAEDISAILAGTYVPEMPELMHREDGRALLYRRRVHSFHGESESGKSMLAQAVVANILRTGGTAAYVDFESDANTVIPRLLMMGAPVPALRERFAYVRPEARGWGDPAFIKLLNEPLDVAIVDGVTESMMIMGVEKSTDNDQVSRWIRAFPRALARGTGAAVVLVDHVTKDSDARGRFALGAQAKMAALDGAGYVIEVKQPLGVGMKGGVSIRVAKDRPGQIRPHSAEFRARDRTQETAYAVIDSTEEGSIKIRFWPPKRNVSEQEQMMIAISMYLEGWRTEHGAPLGKSLRDIRGEVPGRNTDIQAAANRLAAEGYIQIDVGSRNAHIHTSLKPFRVIVKEVDDVDAESVTFDG